MTKITYFFATISPFTYLAGDRLEAIAEKYGATIAYKPLDILTLFSQTGGIAPKDRHPSRLAYRAQELARFAQKTGLAFTMKPAFWPTNPAPSSYAIIRANEVGGGDIGLLVRRFLALCWAEEKDIAEDSTIRQALQEAGFDAGIADMDLMQSAEIYANNLKEAVERGAFGAPFYITDDGACFWGQDRLDDLEAHISGADQSPKPR